LDGIIEPIWNANSTKSLRCLNTLFPTDEAIMEEMTRLERPWEDLHHRSCFLLDIDRIDSKEFQSTMSGDRDWLVNPLVTHGVYVEGKMENIS